MPHLRPLQWRNSVSFESEGRCADVNEMNYSFSGTIGTKQGRLQRRWDKHSGRSVAENIYGVGLSAADGAWHHRKRIVWKRDRNRRTRGLDPSVEGKS